MFPYMSYLPILQHVPLTDRVLAVNLEPRVILAPYQRYGQVIVHSRYVVKTGVGKHIYVQIDIPLTRSQNNPGLGSRYTFRGFQNI